MKVDPDALRGVILKARRSFVVTLDSPEEIDDVMAAAEGVATVALLTGRDRLAVQLTPSGRVR